MWELKQRVLFDGIFKAREAEFGGERITVGLFVCQQLNLKVVTEQNAQAGSRAELTQSSVGFVIIKEPIGMVVHANTVTSDCRSHISHEDGANSQLVKIVLHPRFSEIDTNWRSELVSA